MKHVHIGDADFSCHLSTYSSMLFPICISNIMQFEFFSCMLLMFVVRTADHLLKESDSFSMTLVPLLFRSQCQPLFSAIDLYGINSRALKSALFCFCSPSLIELDLLNLTYST